MKVEVEAAFFFFVRHLNEVKKEKSPSNHNTVMKVLMGNVLASNTEALCSQLV